MKSKHRRLFGQNNRNALHFSLLSAGIRKYLRLHVKFLESVAFCAVITPFCSVQLLAMTADEQINQFISLALERQYPDTSTDDLLYTANLPPTSLEEKTCQTDLSFDWRGELNAGANTLNASCPQPQWQVYIPVTVQIFQNVIVAGTPLSRHNPIKASQLNTVRMDIGTLRMGYFTKAENLTGYQLQRTVKAGQVITPYIAKAPPLVQRGDWVTITSGFGALTVTSTAEALKDGVMGEQIPVRNLKSEQTIRAWVIGKGMVSTKKDRI